MANQKRYRSRYDKDMEFVFLFKKKGDFDFNYEKSFITNSTVSACKFADAWMRRYEYRDDVDVYVDNKMVDIREVEE